MKIACEIDTETKNIKFTVDGQEVDVLEFSMGHYIYNNMCDKDDSGVIDTNTYISITQGDMENKYTHSLCFSNGNNPSYSESKTFVSCARQVGKVISSAISGGKLADLVYKNNDKK